MMNKKFDYSALVRAIKTSLTVTEYANSFLGMNVTDGVRTAATYRNGTNPTSFISYGDSYSDFGFPGGPRHFCDVIQLCADACHNGSRSEAIYELARSHITSSQMAEITNDKVSWDQHIKSLESKINYWHSQLRPEDREYLHSRRISDATINRLKMGYCAMMKRLITPYFHNGHAVYYSGRDVTGEWKVNKKRAKYAKMKISHFYVENVPFGLHTLEPSHRKNFPEKITSSSGKEYRFDEILCVLEGQIDALSFEQEGFQVTSPVGGYFNEMQMPYFLSIARKIGKVFVCFDNDGAGTGFQQKMAQQLFMHKIPFVTCVVPKKIPQMPIKLSGQALFTQGSSIVNVLNVKLTQLNINPGDILTDNLGGLYTIKKVIDDEILELTGNYDKATLLRSFEVTQYIKDVSDYYTAGGNLADLLDMAEDGIISLARIIGDDYKKLREFLKEASKSLELADMRHLLSKCNEIDNGTKAALLKEVTRVPTEHDIVKKIMGYRDYEGEYHKPEYLLKYVDNDGFYEYEHGVWERRRDSQIKKYIAKILANYERNDRINGAFNLLKIRAGVTLQNYNLNNYFNMQPIVNFMNGILDLSLPDHELGRLEPHKPEYLSSLQINQMYDRNAKCPRIMKFLHEVLWYKNEEITRKKLLLLQEYLAYPLFTTNPIHKMLFLLGDGRNGKGTVLELVRAVYGEDCVSYVNPARFNVDFERIYLQNSMVNICFDADKDFRASQEIIKQVVAGENIMACYKFQNHIHFRPRAKLITACNNLVKVSDCSRGFLSRILFLNFNRCYEGRENFNLANELKQELPGFFNWILEGYKRLRKNISQGKGFTLNEEHEETMRLFEEHTSPVFLFYNEKINEFIELQKTQGEYVSMTTSWVYSEYVAWCEKSGYPKKNRGSFTREFKQILKQKHPELFERYGLSMTKHGQQDEYDFACIKVIPPKKSDEEVSGIDREENNLANTQDFSRDITSYEVHEDMHDEVHEDNQDAQEISLENTHEDDYPEYQIERKPFSANPKSSEYLQAPDEDDDDLDDDERTQPIIFTSEYSYPGQFIKSEPESENKSGEKESAGYPEKEAYIFTILRKLEYERTGREIFKELPFSDEEKLIMKRYVSQMLSCKERHLISPQERKEKAYWQKLLEEYGTIDEAITAVLRKERIRRLDVAELRSKNSKPAIKPEAQQENNNDEGVNERPKQ